jgi:hypothetical protein
VSGDRPPLASLELIQSQSFVYITHGRLSCGHRRDIGGRSHQFGKLTKRCTGLLKVIGSVAKTLVAGELIVGLLQSSVGAVQQSYLWEIEFSLLVQSLDQFLEGLHLLPALPELAIQ